jgi:hypothetical protein
VSRRNHGNSPLMAAAAAGDHAEGALRELLAARASVNLTNTAQVRVCERSVGERL